MDLNLIGSRIKEARLDNGMTLEDVAVALGLARSTVQRYEAGLINRPKLPVIDKMAEVLKVSPVWLMGKDVPKHPSPPMQKFPELTEIGKVTFPLFSGIACGEPLPMDERIETYVSATTDIQADFVLRAVGESMEPGIQDGDLVFIRSQPTVDNGQVAAVAIGDNATLKRIFWYPDRKILLLRADNPQFQELIYQNDELEQVRILGKAIALQRDVT